MGNLGNTYADLGQYDLAEPALRKALALDRQLLTADTPELANSLDDRQLAYSINNLAAVLADQRKFAEASALHRESIALRREVFGENSSAYVVALMNLGFVQIGLEDQEAEATMREAARLAEEVFGPEHSRTGGALVSLSRAIAMGGDLQEAVRVAERAVEVLAIAEGPSSFRVAKARVNLGNVYIMSGQSEAGEAELIDGWSQLVAAFGEDNPQSRSAAARIAEHFEQTDDASQALIWRSRAGPAQ